MFQETQRDQLIKNNFKPIFTPNHALIKNFKVYFPLKFGELDSYIKSVQLPPLEMGVSRIAATNNQVIIQPGNAKVFPPLRLNYIIDEYYRTYTMMYEWLDANKDQVHGDADEVSKPLTIVAYDNNMNKEVAKWTFIGAFPVMLEGPEFDYGSQDTDSRILSVSYHYTYFVYEGIQFEDIQQYKNS